MGFETHERRRFGRRSVFKMACLMQGLDEISSCIVVDISVGGARIQIDRPEELPGEFGLAIPEDDVLYDCRIVHRQPTSVGVVFTRSARKLSYAKAKMQKQRELDPVGFLGTKPTIRGD